MSWRERAVSKGPFVQPHTQSVSLTNSYCPDNGDVKQTNITDDVDKAYRSTATIERRGKSDIDEVWEKTMSLMLPAEMDALGGEFL